MTSSSPRTRSSAGGRSQRAGSCPVEDAELEALESYDTSRSIEIRQFVAAETVDPVYFDRTYFLVPAATEAQRRPYALLAEAMREAGVVGLGAFVLAGKEKLCLIRPKGQALALETLFLAEDVKGQEEIDEPIAATGVKKEELALATQIISSLEGTFDPGELKSDYRAKLRELLEAKLDGHELPEAPAEVDDTAPVVDLMEALRASVAASKGTASKNGGETSKPAPSAQADNRRKVGLRGASA